MTTTTTATMTTPIRSLAAMVAGVTDGTADVSRTGAHAIPITSDACAFTSVVDANHGLLRMAQEPGIARGSLSCSPSALQERPLRSHPFSAK
jgi:hypothetical protein